MPRHTLPLLTHYRRIIPMQVLEQIAQGLAGRGEAGKIGAQCVGLFEVKIGLEAEVK